LDVLECLRVVTGLQEEYVGPKDWCDDCAYAIEGLGNIDTELGVFGRTAD
jgi:hypothetical protein